MANELRYYDLLKQAPKEALKTITGGRLKGKSDINPQWRYKAMTEVFGPVGIGWKYEIVKLWSKTLSTGEVLCFAHINLYIMDNGSWSDKIPGTGGSSLVNLESSGLKSSDEGYKMAITDALSVAMKMVGVAGDIYQGLWDGSKYANEEVKKEPAKPATPQPGEIGIPAGLVKELYDVVKEAGGGYPDIIAVAKAYDPKYIIQEGGEDKIAFKGAVTRKGYNEIRIAFETGTWKQIIETGKFIRFVPVQNNLEYGQQ